MIRDCFPAISFLMDS